MQGVILSVSICAVFLLSALSAFAQTPKPSPTPDDDVVKISTNLIRVDVSVTDAKGKVVPDLRADELELYENGQRQKITDVRFVSAGRRVPDAKRAAGEKSSAPLPSAPLRSEAVRRTIALIVDDFQLKFGGAGLTKRALRRFVDEQMEDGDLVAIVRLQGSGGGLQQFTSDKRALYSAIDKVKWNPPLNGIPYPAVVSLEAIAYVVDGMRDLPGRKSAMVFTEGYAIEKDANPVLPVKILDDAAKRPLTGDAVRDDALTGKGDRASVLNDEEQLVSVRRRLTEKAIRSSVVIYPVDVRGPVLVELDAESDPLRTKPQQIGIAMSKQRFKVAREQGPMKDIAADTGGFAILNNNDITAGVRRVLEDQSYYLLSYEPDGETFDAAVRRFNTLEVRVLRQGATALYRSGFFNVPDRERSSAARPATPAEELTAAVSSPYSAGGIDLRLNALFVADDRNAPFVRSVLHIDAADITFTDTPDKQRQAAFEIFAVSFGDNGTVADQLSKSYVITLKPDSAERIKAEGLVYQFVFPVKTPGAYQYRVALRDTASGRIGSASQFIDVPDLKKKNIAVSGIQLESYSQQAWANPNGTGSTADANPLAATALRRLKLGSVLKYDFVVFNAAADAKPPHVTTRTRVFRDGKLVLDGTAAPVDPAGQPNPQNITVTKALDLGTDMEPGDYIIQIIVTDESNPKKPRTATQSAQFELVK